MKTISTIRTLLTLALASLIISHAHAHAVVEPQNGTTGTYQKLTFRITHGCDGSATKEVQIHIPENIHGAKPMPKPGWTLSTQTIKLTTPYKSHGKLISEDTSLIVWNEGKLPNEYFDEFSIQVRLPDEAATVAIPVTQICESGRIDWNEVATPDKPAASLKSPAPVIDITAPMHMNGMDHIH
ncbi:MAG: YcnI family protein [Methylophilaceae bacterium]